MKNLKNVLLLKQLYQYKQLGYLYTSSTLYSQHEVNFTLPSNLNELQQQAYACKLCLLSKSRNNVIFGKGNQSAKVMFIGDFPSSIDDQKGEIFSDIAGELLTKMINTVLLLDKSDVYISNILKCRALNTIEPSSAYIHSCLPYILKEIEFVKPQIIVTLGEMPYHYLTQETTPLEKSRGISIKKENYTIIPTYHPTFLLKNPSLKKEVFEDLKKIKTLLQSAE